MTGDLNEGSPGGAPEPFSRRVDPPRALQPLVRVSRIPADELLTVLELLGDPSTIVKVNGWEAGVWPVPREALVEAVGERGTADWVVMGAGVTIMPRYVRWDDEDPGARRAAYAVLYLLGRHRQGEQRWRRVAFAGSVTAFSAIVVMAGLGLVLPLLLLAVAMVPALRMLLVEMSDVKLSAHPARGLLDWVRQEATLIGLVIGAVALVGTWLAVWA